MQVYCIVHELLSNEHILYKAYLRLTDTTLGTPRRRRVGRRRGKRRTVTDGNNDELNTVRGIMIVLNAQGQLFLNLNEHCIVVDFQQR